MKTDVALALSLTLLSGALYFLGFVGFGFYPLAWFCFVPILAAIRGATPRRALVYGAIFGLFTNLGGYYWIIHLLTDFADLALPFATLGYVLLCAYQGLLLAIVVFAVRRAERDLGVAPVWGLSVAFPALEFSYPLLFPSYIGNSQYQFSAITQIVDVTGMLGLTLLIALVNGASYELLDARLGSRRIVWRRIAVPAVAVAVAIGYGSLRISALEEDLPRAPTLKVALVQTNLGARDKADRSVEFIRRHQEMSKDAIRAHPEIELVVWPESAYNHWIARSDRRLGRRVLGDVDRPVIFGALTYAEGRPAGEREIYNTAVLTSSTGDVLGMFDKVELLAFGETIPLVDTFSALKGLFPRSSVFTRGTTLRHFRLAEVTLLPMICYEDIIPGFVRKIWGKDGPAQVLVNITNDSWYGDTHEPLIHLALASFRSIETRRALIRSTNTGISALVDPVGRIVKRTGQWTRETLVGEVPLVQDGSSTLYMRIGDVIGWLSALVFVGGAAAIVRAGSRTRVHRRESRNRR